MADKDDFDDLDLATILFDPFGRPLSKDDIDDIFGDIEDIEKTVDNLFDNITRKRVDCECGRRENLWQGH